MYMVLALLSFKSLLIWDFYFCMPVMTPEANNLDFMLMITPIIIHSKYFPSYDWLKSHE